MDLSLDVGGALAEFARMFVATLLGSGVAGTALQARSARRLTRTADVRADVDRALDALGALRDGYRGQEAGAVTDNLAVTRLEDTLELAVVRTSAPVVAAAAEYVRVGRLFALCTEDTSLAVEQRAYDALVAALVGERRASS